ncbi:ATP-binding protein [bacterium]
MKVRTRLNAGFVLVILVTIASLYYINLKIGEMNNVFVELQQEIIPEGISVVEMARTANKTAHLTKEYMLDGDAVTEKELMASLQQLNARSYEHVKSAVNATNIEKFRAQSVQRKVQEFELAIGTIVDMKKRGISLDKLVQEAKQTLHEPLAILLEELEYDKAEHISQINTDMRKIAYMSKLGSNTANIASFMSILLAIFISLFIARSITRPLRALHEGTEIVEKGDFAHRVGTKAKDEIGQLSRSFDKMVRYIQNSTTSITQLHTEVKERKIVEEKLRDAMDAKSKFTSMVSHELRTPLTSIKGNLNIVIKKAGLELDEKMRNFLVVAQNNVERLHRLINEVLDFSKLESGNMEYFHRKQSINPIIEKAVSMQEVAVNSKGLYLKTDLQENISDINCDADKITQVLINLMNNAQKFTEVGGITVGTVKEANALKVFVEDTGPGMKDEDLDKIFAEYQQIVDGNYRKPGSSGLGLAICREIVAGHEGKIWAESVLGKGSKFIFTLPLQTCN